MNDDSNDDEYPDPPAAPPPPAVGYKAPPKSHRFKKGTSGNPKGRPLGAQGKKKIVEKVLFEEHEIIENGHKIRYTAIELVIIAFRNHAFQCNNRAFKAFEALDAEYDPQKPSLKAGCLVVPGRLTKESWVRVFGAKVPMNSEEE